MPALSFGASRPGWKQVLAVAAIFFALGKLSHMTAFLPVGPTPLWLPSGFAVAAVLLLGPWTGIGIALGSTLIAASVNASFWSGLSICLANTLEPLLGACLMRGWFKYSGGFSRLRDVFGLLIGGALASSAAGASVGVTGLSLTGDLPWVSYGGNWWNWWTPNVLSILVVTPAILALSGYPTLRPKLDARRLLEVCGACLLATSFAAFIFLLPPSVNGGAFAYWIFPFVIWIAIRGGVRATVLEMLVISALAIFGAAIGKGPFVSDAAHERLVLVQVFLAVIAVAGLFLATALSEREEAIAERSELVSQLQLAVRMRDDFLSIASHEFKTPLTSLSMQIQIINQLAEKGALAQLSKEKLSELLRISQQQLDRFAALVNELLDASRIDAGRLALATVDFDLVEQVDAVLQRFGAELESSGCAVTRRGDPQVLLRGDVARMEQVITNLLSNAVKYGRGKPIEIVTQGSGNRARLIVRDYGIGISKEDQARIFERFERAVSLKSFGGLGLGLYITRQIVDAHGGTVRVESEPGAGSAFIVEIPRLPDRP